MQLSLPLLSILWDVVLSVLPECNRRWFFKFVCLLNPLWHTWHLNGQVPVCTYVWDLRSPGVGKDLEHIVHLCGFSWKLDKRKLLVMHLYLISKKGCRTFQYSTTFTRLKEFSHILWWWEAATKHLRRNYIAAHKIPYIINLILWNFFFPNN